MKLNQVNTPPKTVLDLPKDVDMYEDLTDVDI